MPRLFFAELLSPALLRRHGGRAARADVCTALTSADSGLSSQVLGDPRWTAAATPVFNNLSQTRLAGFTERLVEQILPGDDRTRRLADALACGLDFRLLPAFTAGSLVEHCLQIAGAGQVELDAVASSPYVRNLLRRTFRPRLRALRLHGLPDRSPLSQAAREVAAGQLWARRLSRSQRAGARPPSARSATRGKRALLYTASYRSLSSIKPVIERLAAEGWRLTVISYGTLADRSLFAEIPTLQELPFETAAAGWTLSGWDAARWSWERVPPDGPLSARALRWVVGASWASTAVQAAKQARILDVLRPDAVVSFSVDPATLALEAMAEARGIPSLFIPHGFTYATPFAYVLPARLSLLFNEDCVRLNRHLARGRRELRATGYPPFDQLAADRLDPPPVDVPRPADRPHLVAAFHTHGLDLVAHLLQERFLRTLARALPASAFLVCKLHPGGGENRIERSRCEQMLAAELPPGAYRVVSEKDLTTRHLLGQAAVAVSLEWSTVLVDAIVRGCPAVAFRNPEYPLHSMDHQHPAKDYDAYCRVVSDLSQMRAALEQLLAGSAARESFLQRRREFLERIGVGDGNAAARMAQAIAEVATPQPAGASAPAASLQGSTPPTAGPPHPDAQPTLAVDST